MTTVLTTPFQQTPPSSLLLTDIICVSFYETEIMIMLKVNHPENPATEAQLSCPIALLGSPSPQLTNWHQVENNHHEDGDYNDDDGEEEEKEGESHNFSFIIMNYEWDGCRSHLVATHQPTDDQNRCRVGSVRSNQQRNPASQPRTCQHYHCDMFSPLRVMVP